MKLSDEKLQYAAKLAAKAELEPWLDYEAYEEPVFSEKFQQRMQALIENVRAGSVAQDRARLGWQYYSRRGLAAVLLCFLLSCIAMPEAVMAGCRKVIEVVRTVYEEYTEYHITSNSFREVFAPLQFTYIPDSFKEVEREQYPNRIYILYESGELYFSLNQTALKQEKGFYNKCWGVTSKDVIQPTLFLCKIKEHSAPISCRIKLTRQNSQIKRRRYYAQ